MTGKYITSDSESVEVTVLVPAYRPGEWIDRLLSSLAEQEGCSFRVAISIDHSRGEDEAAVRQAVGRYLPSHDVSVVTHPNRLGWVDNTNHLLSDARTRFVCVLPQDDYVGRHYLARLRTAHEQHPGASVTFCDMRLEGNGYGQWEAAWNAIWSSRLRNPLRRWRLAREIWREGVVIRASSLCGDRDERVRLFLLSYFNAVAFRGMIDTGVMGEHLRIRHGRDDDFAADAVWMLVMADRGPIIRVPEVLYFKCFHQRNTHTPWEDFPKDCLWSRWLAHCQDCHEQLLRLGWPDGSGAKHQPWLVQRQWQSARHLWPSNSLPKLSEKQKQEYLRKLMAE